ncbi:extracellular solute-binding protein [Corynebacterium sphenisci]|uniref:extracellular solute-binding protein n=1 Tax=Corynebacterium sphenisci TaxID=191493 RepID=UPI0026DFF4D5|nr:extracellular solute-binding protein [Corynebacterium sphenisci]MDO5730150.1 extracellular solute-binding protein [Corynebacterium sphenisci]
MSVKKKLPATGLALAGLAGALVGCGSDSGSAGDASGAAAADSPDGALVIYSGRSEDLVAPLIEKFAEGVDYDVDVRYGKSAEQAQLLLTEGEATPADVFFSQESGALGLVSEQGMLAPLSDAVLDRVPAGFAAADGTWVGVTGRARVVAYDRDTVDAAEAPDTVEAMVDPKWKGRIGVAPGNASFIAFVSAMRDARGDEATAAWLDKLVANEPVIYEKNSHILEGVDTGEVAIGLINHYYWFREAAERGGENMRAQLKYGAAGDLAALVNATGVGVLAGAAEDDRAREFVDFLLSDAAQTWFTETTFEFPLIDGIASPEGVPALDSMTVPDVDLAKLGDVAGTTALIDASGLTSM